MAEVMTDREMLELAAKAAGISGYRYSDGFGCMAHWNESDGGWLDACCLWDPLRNDGDALRLAVKMSLDINPYPKTGEVAAIKWGDNQVVNKTFVRCGDDPCAATRRAIVRAAAEIGKGV